jgi:hypothetical protein
MSSGLLTWAAAAAGGAVTGWLALRVALNSSFDRLVRTNVGGRRVPAVLGGPLLVGALTGAFVVGLVGSVVDESLFFLAQRLTAALTGALFVAILFVGGLVDDLRGDEGSRGFGGHLRALRSGRITGGIIKIAAGGIAGLVAAWMFAESSLIESFLMVPLAANLFNLLDTAPGRAAKGGAVALGALSLASGPFAIAAAGTFGALLAVLPADLGERAMLGDAGANSMGALVGVGLIVVLGEPWRAIALVGLVALNLASERISFARVIDETWLLRAVDRLGRRRTHTT